MQFKDRVALVTGGGRGIGAETAKVLAAGGAAVAVTDMDLGPAQETAAEIRAAGGRAIGIACDVTSRGNVDAAFEQAVKEFGRLDILFACAGITRDNLLHKMTEDEWDAVVTTHLKGSFLSAQAAQRYMVAQNYGKIVLTSSTSALGNRGQANYSAVKAGIQGLTKTLAIELGAFGINVNAVAPGFIETRMTRATAERMGVDFEQMKAAAAKVIPLRRVGQPKDVAHVVAFLSSDQASYVSGQVIYIAGGPKA
ncbi:MAG: SDR family NAD(P)-dependent oxidoreductase [Thermaerobacter sp.]|nr:SDR family NAD(P)-dependent oxidoreductase [Thermaerobacter sp.]